MRFVLVSAVKDLRRRMADPAALLIWIGIPLAIATLMNLVSGGGETVPRARVLVADQDDTLLSRLLAGAGARGGLGEYVDLEQVPTAEEGRRRIDAGEAAALLVLPEGFQDAVLREEPAELQLVTNPAQRILPRIVEEGLEILTEAVFYVQRVFGPTIRRMIRDLPAGATGPSGAEVAAISVEINEELQRLQGLLFPPAIRLDIVTDRPQAGPELNFGQLFLPGMLFMSILFIADGMSADVWEEKTRGTLRRALTTPQTARRLLAGKVVAGAALGGTVALVALLAAIALFDIAWTRVPLAWLWCTFAGAALLPLLMLLQMAAASERGGRLLGSMVVFPLIMIGGSFFPFEAMPAWMSAVGRWTPNGLAVLRLKDLLYGEPQAGPLLVAAAGIGVPAALAFLLAARRVAGRFATG